MALVECKVVVPCSGGLLREVRQVLGKLGGGYTEIPGRGGWMGGTGGHRFLEEEDVHVFWCGMGEEEARRFRVELARLLGKWGEREMYWGITGVGWCVPIEGQKGVK